MNGMLWEKGLVLTVPLKQAMQFIRLGLAEPTEPEKTAISPPERR